MSTKTLQTLICQHDGGHEWTREPSRGKPPHYCPEHKPGSATPRAKAEPKPEPAPDLPAPKPTVIRWKTIPGQHRAYQEALHYLSNGKHVYLFGESGTGKTHAAMTAAGDLSVPLTEQPCHPLMNAEDLFGFRTATGAYVPGIVREWLENEAGGVLLLDEMDAANPALLVAINMVAALSPGKAYRFPDGTRLTRTANHVIVAAGNTNGLGATSNYQGRASLDRATLTRFAFISWDYDESLEMFLQGQDDVGKDWVSFVHTVRRIARDNSLPLLITQRAVIEGADMLRKGTPRKSVEASYLWQGCDADTLRTVKAALKAEAAKAEEANKPEPTPDGAPKHGDPEPEGKRCCAKTMVWDAVTGKYVCHDFISPAPVA